ncbi:Transposase family Tnp2 protein [Ceratobasidium sp. AG-Ba]|nr:Transposase family Tnp2 protein [Ceratobasidium sp. AG-Ba]
MPIHALLHIADDIEAMGPVWCYWSFPMERYCGSLSRVHKSRRFPYSSLDRRVRKIAELGQIKLIYGLADELNLEERRDLIVKGTKYDGYPDLVFAEPKRYNTLTETLCPKVADFIASATGVPSRDIQHQLKRRSFVIWGRMQQVDDGRGHDLVRACAVSPDKMPFLRDASYVKESYWTYLSRWRWDRSTAQIVENSVEGFGRVDLFIVIDTNFLQAVCKPAGVEPPTNPLVLAAVLPIPHLRRHNDANIIEYKLQGKKLLPPEIIDVSDIDCLIGCYQAPTPSNATFIVDRTTVVGRMDVLDDTANPD